MQSPQNIANKYLKSLEESDLEGILNLFALDAIVLSPIYGTMAPRTFYTTLFNDTRQSRIQLHDIFSNDNQRSFALYFEYKWILSNDKSVVFDVVDIIEMNEESKIIKLKIIYDTIHSRKEVNSLRTC